MQIDDWKNIVKDAGLSDNESEVYLLLLESNEALAAEIAKKSKISRPHIYDTLAKLTEKGLCSSFMKSGKKYFQPANPEVLLELIKLKEDRLKSILPSLKKLNKPKKKKPKVEVYEGTGGLKTILKEVVREGKDFIGIGATTKWKDQIPIEYEQYKRERDKIGFKGKLLHDDKKPVLDLGLNSYRKVSSEHIGPVTSFIFGEKTCMVLWLDTPVSILIDNKELSDSFRKHFSLLWNLNKNKKD